MKRTKLDALALKIDKASDNADRPELMNLIGECNDWIKTDSKNIRPILHFFKANCYAALSAFSIRDDPDYKWSWNQSDSIEEILSLRRAISDDTFREIDEVYQCKIFVNLGNKLNHLGRFVEAIRCWNEALIISPNSAMAAGNLGQGLTHYANSLYDYGHAGILFSLAKDNFQASLMSSAIWDSGLQQEAQEQFKMHASGLTQHLKDIEYDEDFDLDQWPLGENEDEIEYRGWCLHHRLILSPLNDATRKSVAARDSVHLPSHIYKIEENPRFPNYYNILKQEYITARYMLYSGSRVGSTEHMSDKKTLLLNGADGARYSYRNEQIKCAYRIAYSIFDKIALFLNDYFSVGLKEARVSFRGIWGQTKNQTFQLYPCFLESKNWPLRGLERNQY
jgi:tetratricopeptide (TPR) repeat protein